MPEKPRFLGTDRSRVLVEEEKFSRVLCCLQCEGNYGRRVSSKQGCPNCAEKGLQVPLEDTGFVVEQCPYCASPLPPSPPFDENGNVVSPEIAEAGLIVYFCDVCYGVSLAYTGSQVVFEGKRIRVCRMTNLQDEQEKKWLEDNRLLPKIREMIKRRTKVQ